MISINHPYPKGNKNEEKVATSAPKYTFAAAPANSGTRIKKDANEEMKNAAGSSGPASVDEVYYEPGSPTTGSGSPSPSVICDTFPLPNVLTSCFLLCFRLPAFSTAFDYNVFSHQQISPQTIAFSFHLTLSNIPI